MKERKDPLEQQIKAELREEADSIEKIVEASGQEGLSDEKKRSIKTMLQEEIEDIEVQSLLGQLPERYQRAVAIGLAAEEKRFCRRKKRRVYLSACAVLVLVLAAGLTSIGGPERVMKIMKRAVGEREVLQADSDKDNLVICTEDEEEAYQKAEDEFGIKPVRAAVLPKGTVFVSGDIQKDVQVAEFLYDYQGERILYMINMSFGTDSWGVDVEDKVTDQYYRSKDGVKIEIKEYQPHETERKRYSISFCYQKGEYFLIGSMSKEDIEYIVENLYFY